MIHFDSFYGYFQLICNVLLYEKPTGKLQNIFTSTGMIIFLFIIKQKFLILCLNFSIFLYF